MRAGSRRASQAASRVHPDDDDWCRDREIPQIRTNLEKIVECLLGGRVQLDDLGKPDLGVWRDSVSLGRDQKHDGAALEAFKLTLHEGIQGRLRFFRLHHVRHYPASHAKAVP